MRIIKLIIASIVFLSVIITIISLFIPSQIRLSKAVQINASAEEVMQQLSDPVNWRNWYPGADSSTLIYKNDSVRGLVLDENKHRSIIITGAKKDEVTAQYVLPNREIPTGWQIASSREVNSVTVQWYIEFHLRWYPWEKFTSFMFERVYNPQLQKGLDNLKDFVERRARP